VKSVGRGLSNADKTTTVLFTNKRLMVGFKKPTLFGQEFELKIQVKLYWNNNIMTIVKKELLPSGNVEML
jgi:hypothetical protein